MKAHLTYKGQPACFKSSRIRCHNAAGLGGYHELVGKDEFEKRLQKEPEYCCKRCMTAYRTGRYDR